MSGINAVTLSGRVSRSPRRIRGSNGGYQYVFPLAVRDGDDRLVFPMVTTTELPEFVTYHPGKKLHEQPLVTVSGKLQTRNVTRPLANELAALARRAGATHELIAAIRDVLAHLNLPARRVVTEVVAQTILEGGVW